MFRVQGAGFRVEGLPKLIERAVEDEAGHGFGGEFGYGFGREFGYETGRELGRDTRDDGRKLGRDARDDGRDTTPDPWKRSPKVNRPCKAAVFKSQERSRSDLPPPAVWRGTEEGGGRGHPNLSVHVLNLRPTTLHKCAAVPRRARMQGS